MPSLPARVCFPYPCSSAFICGRFLVVGQFGVSEIDCLTEPSAVAPDAGVKLRTKQVAHHPWPFSGLA